MRTKKYKYFMCDFETTVYEGQTSTEVWASACVELFTDDVIILHSIEEQYNYFLELDTNVCAYYHNLKFDGAFWLSYLMTKTKLKQATYIEDSYERFYKEEEMPNNSFKYVISELGQWYTITIKVHNHFIVLRDSLKLLPFSVQEIGKGFKTKHQKLSMEYKGYRYAGCEITDEEKEYIANDVLVVKEALEMMIQQGHNKLTIGSCCLAEFKKTVGRLDYKEMFPNLLDFKIDDSLYDSENADAYIRKSYKGGWCYVVKGKEGKVKHNGITADVNSLYPSMMHSQSGNCYPIGNPQFWKGSTIPEEALHHYYFVRIKTRFYLKKNKLPFIQIKNSLRFKGNEALESSDYFDRKTNKYYTKYYDTEGTLHDTRIVLTLTKTDFELFNEHYDTVDFEILDGCWFYTANGIFDMYIDKYAKIKMENKGALRQEAKLFLNNLYGKLASSDESSYKVAFVKDDNSIGYRSVPAHDKAVGYIPIGSAITSYARNFTIRAAQSNYYGVDKKGFIYADTDSIHCDIEADKVKGITVDPVKFCCWKLESYWDVGIFTRQKTYIEHVTHEDQEPIDEPYYNVKCAGMPEKCKQLFLKTLNNDTDINEEEYTEEELEFLKQKHTIKDFKIGLRIPGKLIPRTINGGIVLQDTTYEIR